MKKNIFITLVSFFVISLVFSGCIEHRYYRDNKHHSRNYYERRHMSVPVGIEFDIHK